jgi:histidyl-tRNA synthetase
MRHADRLGAPKALILDESGSIQLRDMSSGEQREIEVAELVEELVAR